METLVSVDGGFTGPIPGRYSMISLGAVAFNEDGKELDGFSVNLKELPKAIRDEKTMTQFWDKNPAAWKQATENSLEPVVAMKMFAGWLTGLPTPVKLMGWPYPIDFSFVYWYYIAFAGDPPFGYDGLDIKSYAMRTFQIPRFSDVSRTDVCKRLGLTRLKNTHDALEDAREQGLLYFALRDYEKDRSI